MQVRLFCLPYAGGSAAVYRNWSDLLPPTIEVCPIELPGRGQRFAEAPCVCMETLLQRMLTALQPMLSEPFALFGHSLGAVLAYEITRRQAEEGGDLPRHLFLSGQRAPHRPDPNPPKHDLSEDEFLEQVRDLGGTPPEIFAQPELLELFLPILRADFELGETFKYPAVVSLPCPISALGGTEDPEISVDDVVSWETYSRSSFRFHLFAGNHFFLQQREAEVVARVEEDLLGRS